MESHPIQEQYFNLLRLNLLPVPYSKKHKGPKAGIEWARRMREHDPRPYKLDEWKSGFGWMNIGIFCNDIVCLDFDIAKDNNEICGVEFMNRLIEFGVLDEKRHAHEISRSGGYHWYFRAPVEMPILRRGNKVLKYVDADGGKIPVAMDVIHNMPVKCYPSDGYQLVNPISPEYLHEIPQEIIDMLKHGGLQLVEDEAGVETYKKIMINENIKRAIKEPRQVDGVDPSEFDIHKLEIILDNINPDDYVSYDEWTNIGMALYNTFADSEKEELALGLWDKYSAKYGGHKYNPSACAEKWLSFSVRDNGFTIGTLIFKCNKNNPNALSNFNVREIRRKASDINALEDIHDADGNVKENLNIFTDVYRLYCDPESPAVNQGEVLRFLKATIAYNEAKDEFLILDVDEDPLSGAKHYFYNSLTRKELKDRTRNRFMKINKEVKGVVEADSISLAHFIEKFINDIAYHKVRFYPYAVGEDPLKNLTHKDLNLFKGYIQQYDPEFEVNEVKISPFLNHIKQVWCDNNEEEYKYTVNWLAHAIKHPNIKMGVSLFLYSNRQGTGKNILFDMIAKSIIGYRYSPVITSMEHITGNFNEGIEHATLAVCDELTDATSVRRDNDRLKAIMTGKKLFINRKFKAGEMVDNFTNFVMLSNNHNAVMPGRRVFALHCSEKPMPREYFDNLGACCENDEAIKHFFHYLVNKDLGGFNPASFPESRHNKTQAVFNMPAPVKFLVETIIEHEDIDNAPASYTQGTQDFYNKYKDWCGVKSEKPVRYDVFKNILVDILGKSERRAIEGRRIESYIIDIVKVKGAIKRFINRDPNAPDAIDLFKK